MMQHDLGRLLRGRKVSDNLFLSSLGLKERMKDMTQKSSGKGKCMNYKV